MIGLLTLLMGGLAYRHGLEIAQDYGKIVPPNDEDFLFYKQFKKTFGEDGNVVVIGIEADWRKMEVFNDLFDMTEEVKKISGVENVVSLSHLIHLQADEENEQFKVLRISEQKVASQSEMDSLASLIDSLPFYKGRVLADDGKTSLMAVNVKAKVLDSKEKIRVFDALKAIATKFEQKHQTKLHFSGLPVLRMTLSKTLPKELGLFLLLSIFVSAVILWLFFRSFYAVLVPLIIIFIVITWVLGIQAIFGYKMTLVMGIVPALVTVIGIPNGVYLTTKYHLEYAALRNKSAALTSLLEKIGIVTVMTNATTVIGLGATAYTDITILQEFGIVSGIAITCAFFISIFLIPIIFSYLPEPDEKQLKHLDNKALIKFLNWLGRAVLANTGKIYVITLLIAVASIYGASKIETFSRLADDVPKGSEFMNDLEFMEQKFKGVMPFEILIDTKREKGLQKLRAIEDISALQDSLDKYPEISKTLSLSDFSKFLRQGFMGGGASEYVLPTKNEFLAIKLFLKNTKFEVNNFSKTLSDSTQQKTRISGNIEDIGSAKMKIVLDSVQKDIDAIFDSTYQVSVTGTTKVYVKGNSYLVSNLIQSLVLTLILIAILMLLIFKSVRYMILSIIPNILPLMMVAGFMGFMGIPLKPSTALIFSVVFGIAIDNTIHFLAAYRLHRQKGVEKNEAIIATFDNTGYSMIYTSLVLFFGFAIFVASSFGGTQALGYLVGTTLLIALFSNLFFLPSLVKNFGN
ncbi:MAG: efflux RND transporter permease subunit [Bacteroidia bacterium]